jgi:predicted nucleic acid-binding protein
MIVLCDTSPICYLILIGQIDLLPQLFQSVIIPVAVRNELLNEDAGNSIHEWIQNPPTWLNIRTIPQPLLPLPNYLGAGEREAISLAVSLQADLVIIDDLDARTAAQQLNLPIIGTLGILYRAGITGLIDFPSAIAQLQQTSFHVSQTLVQQLLQDYYRNIQRP